MFRKLQPHDADGLYAQWFGVDQRWELRNAPRDSVVRRFKQAANQAALKALNQESWQAFLNLLKNQEHTFHRTGSFMYGDKVDHEIGVIPRVCEAAADYCEKCAPEEESPTLRERLIERLHQLEQAPPQTHSMPQPVTLSEAVAGNRNDLSKSVLISQSAPTCAQLERLRQEAHMSVEELAEAIDTEPRSVYRHLSGQVLPQPKFFVSYERVFTQRLGRTVHITKVSGKCQ